MTTVLYHYAVTSLHKLITKTDLCLWDLILVFGIWSLYLESNPCIWDHLGIFVGWCLHVRSVLLLVHMSDVLMAGGFFFFTVWSLTLRCYSLCFFSLSVLCHFTRLTERKLVESSKKASSRPKPLSILRSLEEKYVAAMKKLQFGELFCTSIYYCFCECCSQYPIKNQRLMGVHKKTPILVLFKPEWLLQFLFCA